MTALTERLHRTRPKRANQRRGTPHDQTKFLPREADACSIAPPLDSRAGFETQNGQFERRYHELVASTRAVPWEADPESLRPTYIGGQIEHLLGYPVDDWYRDG